MPHGFPASIVFSRFIYPVMLALCIALLAIASPTDATAADARDQLVWATGQRDDTGLPKGKLLSDNNNYWGDSILTGVEYTYESDADNPLDRIANQKETFGRRLLDGRVRGNWHVPVGQARGPMIVVFDFKRPCQFNEVTVIATRSTNVAINVETRSSPDEPWRMVKQQAAQNAPLGAINRVRFAQPAPGRYLRLSLQAEEKNITYIDEVLVWGNAEVSNDYPENIAPTYRLEKLQDQWESIPGIKATQFDQTTFTQWKDTLGKQGDDGVIWALASSPSPDKPVLPDDTQRNTPLAFQLTRNETESKYVTLTNTSIDRARTITIEDIHWRKTGSSQTTDTIVSEIRVGGALPARPPKQRLTDEQKLRLHLDPNESVAVDEAGVRVLPFFTADEMLGQNMMKRYLTNGQTIHTFPQVTLPPGGAAVFMVRVTTSSSEPGTYQAHLTATTDEGQKIILRINAKVFNVNLPNPRLWVRSWGEGTSQFPFETQARRVRDVLVNRQLGVTVWSGWPKPGSKAEMFGRLGPTDYRLRGIPSKYVHQGYGNKIKAHQLKDKDKKVIKDHVRQLVAQAKALNLAYDQWWVELWDEPQEKNVELFGALARMIHEVDPEIQIYMNPLFWRPGHAPPQKVFDDLAPFYNDLIAISVPVSTLVKGPDVVSTPLWKHKRPVNAMFIHPATRAGRQFSWQAFALGFNGWGYYCYFVPRGNPWDIRTWRNLNYGYQMVFPSAQGPIPTPIYETMRDGWEDYRLLTALKEAGHTDKLKHILDGLSRKQQLDQLRQTALEAFE